MAKLVDELQQEHQVIIGYLDAIRVAGVTSPEGQSKLQLARKGLLAHLKKEDERLYPLLNKAAQSSPELKRTLEIFAKDMDEISRNAEAFFHKYSNGGSGIEFAKDFGSLIATLNQRIQKEESVIYKRFNEIA
ncbi:hemerythrin domain-containing protein [Aliikangiella maris]|uniref:Hemerythrin domain-containing protein n=2 Tax=Aliikangiella maris TaxID=3162458 RepID=A0ABV3MNN0_9GAMM